MCGIAGILTTGRADPQVVAGMTDAVAHRGPDDAGCGSTRRPASASAIAGLRSSTCRQAGHQPMLSRPTAASSSSSTAKSTIIRELRAELEAEHRPSAVARPFRHRDIARRHRGLGARGDAAPLGRHVRLRALGPARAAAAPGPRPVRREAALLWLGRRSDLPFGSELKALRRCPASTIAISRDALALFTARNYIPAPLSIYERHLQVAAGSILTLSPEAVSQPRAHACRVADRAEGGVQLRTLLVLSAGLGDGLADPDCGRGGSAGRA